MRFVLLAVCAMGMLAPVWGDEAGVEYRGIGGALQLISPEHASIRMVRERVDVRIVAYTSVVRCVFVFKNEGRATTVKMGFPESGRYTRDRHGRSQMDYFRSWVDGKPVATRYTAQEVTAVGGYSGWHLKDVHFAAGQTLEVVDEYAVDLGGIFEFEYILKTGSSWKGRIGEAVVIVDIAKAARELRLVYASPPAYSKVGKKVIWTFKDFEPGDDIEMSFTDHVRLNGLNEEADNREIEDYDEADYRMIDGTMMVNLRYCSPFTITEAKGHGKRRVFSVTYGDRTLKLTDGEKEAVLNDSKLVRLPAAPRVDKNGIFMVPVRGVVTALGGKIGFDANDWCVYVRLPPAKKPGKQK